MREVLYAVARRVLYAGCCARGVIRGATRVLYAGCCTRGVVRGVLYAGVRGVSRLHVGC